MELVETGRLLEDAVIDGILALLIGGRADHAVLEAVSILPVESQVHRHMAVGPLDLLEPFDDLVALFFSDHEERIPLHLLLELVLLIVELLPKVFIIKESLGTLSLHICEDQHAAGQVLGELSDLLHSSHPLLLGHVKKSDLKVLPALADRHAAAKIDGFLLLLGYEIDLVRHRRNIRGAGGTLDRNNVHIVPLRFRCHLFLKEILDLLGGEEMVHLLGRDPDNVICQVLQAQFRISAAEKVIQKVFTKINRSLHISIIANNLRFGIKKYGKKPPAAERDGRFLIDVSSHVVQNMESSMPGISRR